MTKFLRLSEHSFSQQWLAQFYTPKDRALAVQLLNQLKLVSTREFEAGIELLLTNLQNKLQAPIAVYPISSPTSDDIIGYDQFMGGISKNDSSKSIEIGRRKKFGSEDRVGHVLTKLQERFKRGEGASNIECQPTLMHLKTQGIRHIVLVDDVSGSGKRITDYWKKTVPLSIKSLLSLKRCELWIVLYAITPTAKVALKKLMPNFPLSDHLITFLPEFDQYRLLTEDLHSLCTTYAKRIGIESAGLGFRKGICPVVFEHGCPNNLPGILWWNKRPRVWKSLFPNGSIPFEMRSYFDDDGTERGIEALWKANQPKLAFSLLNSLEHTSPLTSDQRMLLMLLGLSLRGIPEEGLASRLFLSADKFNKLLIHAINMKLYDKASARVTPMGRQFVTLFRERVNHHSSKIFGINPEDYYPDQCEGKHRKLGKTNRSNARLVPVESL